MERLSVSQQWRSPVRLEMLRGKRRFDYPDSSMCSVEGDGLGFWFSKLTLRLDPGVSVSGFVDARSGGELGGIGE